MCIRDRNIKIIEQDRERAEMLLENVPSNVSIFLGDGRDVELLLNEGITETDAFLALTGNSEANILACLMAKQYGVRKTVAEVENLDYINMAERFDIGTIINKKVITASKIYELLLKADVSNIKCLTFADANVGEIIAKPNSKVTKKLIKNLNLPPDITFGALIRNGEPILVDGNTLIQAYDKVVVFFPVSYTHLDVYKRQMLPCKNRKSSYVSTEPVSWAKMGLPTTAYSTLPTCDPYPILPLRLR